MSPIASLPDDVMWHIVSYCVPRHVWRIISPSVGSDRLRMLDIQCDWRRRYLIHRQIHGIVRHFERRPFFGAYSYAYWEQSSQPRPFNEIGFPQRFFMLCYPICKVNVDPCLGYVKKKRLPVELGHPFD